MSTNNIKDLKKIEVTLVDVNLMWITDSMMDHLCPWHHSKSPSQESFAAQAIELLSQNFSKSLIFIIALARLSLFNQSEYFMPRFQNTWQFFFFHEVDYLVK